jgi:O-acetyl-ADP-ribose deacetylase (regulator of RNase III)
MSNVRPLIGDLFGSEAQTLTNTVNTVGVMGKGIALQFRKRFPEMYEDYARRCERNEVRLGRPYLYSPLVPPWILNFPTKEHWRSVSRLDAITDGLDFLVKHYREWGIESLAVPPLGCGEGGLEWRVVGPTLYRGLARLDIPVELYAPFGTPHEELQPEFLAGDTSAVEAPASRVPAEAVAVATILERIDAQRYHYPIGKTAMQKIAYFATQAGIPTGLEFERGSYGPFAHGLKQMISRLVNNGLIEEVSRGQMIENRPGSTLHDAQVVFKDELSAWEEQIDRVTDLFLRLPTTRAAEIAASVHYVAASLGNRNRARGGRPVDEDEVVEQVVRWKARRKPPATPDEIAGAARTLAFLDWIDVEPAARDPLDVLV